MIQSTNSKDIFATIDSTIDNSEHSEAQCCGVFEIFQRFKLSTSNLLKNVSNLPRSVLFDSKQYKATTEVQKPDENSFSQNTIVKSVKKEEEEEETFNKFEVPDDSQSVRIEVLGDNTRNFIPIQGKNDKLLGCVFEQSDSEFPFQNVHLEFLVVGDDGILRQVDPLANYVSMTEKDRDNAFSKSDINPVNNNVKDRVAQTNLNHIASCSSQRKRNVKSNQVKKKGQKKVRRFIRKRLFSTKESCSMSSRRSSLNLSTDDQSCTTVTNFDSYDSGIEMQSVKDDNNQVCIKNEIEQIGRQNYKSVKFKPSHHYSKIGVRVRMQSSKLMRLHKSYRRHIRDCFKDIEGLTLKSFVKELHIEHRSIPMFGLGSYFDRLNRGENLSNRDRMQYEWLRLASFQHYTGNGNALSLARNGFYHDPTDGPTSTRCYLCEAIHSTWEYFDNIEAEHRRQSPDCPFHENGRGQSTSIDASFETCSQLHMDPVSPTNSPRHSQESFQDNSLPREVSYSTYSSMLYSVTDRFGKSTMSTTRSVTETATFLSNQQTCRRVTGDDHHGDFPEPDLPIPATPTAGELGITERRTATSVSQHSQLSTENSQVTQQSRENSQQKEHCTELNQQVITGANGSTTSHQNTGFNVTASSSVSSTFSSTTSTSESLLRPAQILTGRGSRTDPTITVVVDNAKHPDYRELDARINSYQGWPDYLDQTARQMAEAGFFFAGVADSTRCFCCGGGLRNWEPGDDPMLEHTRWFPRCEYVNKLKGEGYVAAVQRRHQQHMAEQHRQQQEFARSRGDSQTVKEENDKQALKEENKKLREMQTCKICMERLVNTTLLPCGHLVCCDVCAARLNRCPICRKRIYGTIKTFIPQ